MTLSEVARAFLEAAFKFRLDYWTRKAKIKKFEVHDSCYIRC